MQPKIEAPFTGFMNLDTPSETIPKGHHRYARNIDFLDGVARNVVGTTKYPNPYLPITGTNVTIGRKYDDVNNREFIFNYNSLGNHGIYIFNTITKTFNTLIANGTSTDGDILGFDANVPIHSINVFYGDVVSGDLLTYVDSLYRPTEININKFLTNPYTICKRAYIDVAKPYALMPIKAVYENSTQSSSSTFNILTTLNRTNNTQYFKIVFLGDVIAGINIYISFITESISGLRPLEYNNFSYTTNGSDTRTTIANNLITYLNGLMTQNSSGNPVPLFNASSSIVGVVNAPANTLADDTTLYYISSTFTNPVTNTTPIVNNLKGKLFQFRSRYVFDTYEKSLFSYASNTPLPNISSTDLLQSDYTKNNRIALYVPTGDVNVIKIDIAVRITEDGVTSDWKLLDSLDKGILGINNNTVYRYLFYNNSVLTDLTTEEQYTLQDKVPIKTETQTVLNGNILSYGDITEGYNPISGSMNFINTINTPPNQNTIFAEANGLLFFAECNGNDSGGIGNSFNFYITGTGLNDANGNPSVIDTPFSTLYCVVNFFDGTNIIQSNILFNPNLYTTITNITNDLTSKGFTITSIGTNSFTATYPTNITLLSSGTEINFASVDGSVPFNSYINRSNQSFGIMYFDDKMRTNGVVYTNALKVRMPLSSYTAVFSTQLIWAVLQINHRPPLWATKYVPVRSEGQTYSKILYWVSSASISDVSSNTSNQYAYINIDNITDYNAQIEATEGVVSYAFGKGDRITIYGRYDSSGTEYTYNSIYDYEILGVETNPNINGVPKVGIYIKILYPMADIGTYLNFSGDANYQNYKIILYGIKEAVTAKQTVFYEIGGKVFGIGNAGTTNAYHIGDMQTQSTDLSTPANVSIVNGDAFFRKRQVLLSTKYQRSVRSGYGSNLYTTYWIGTGSNDYIDMPDYKFNYQEGYAANIISNTFPNYSDGAFFENKSSTKSFKIRIKAQAPVSSTNLSGVAFYIKLVDSSNTATSLNIVPIQAIQQINVGYLINIDSTFVVPANQKAFLIWSNVQQVVDMFVGAFVIDTYIYTQYTIPVYDFSFSDFKKLVTNSNSRETAIDYDAKQTKNNVLIRWSRPRQTGTNINEINRFYDNNYIEANNEYGAVKRLDANGQKLHVFQERKCGVTGVYNKYIKNSGGDTQLIVTDTILTSNNIEYYIANNGIGNQSMSLVRNGFQYYFPDPVKGQYCRLSQDGVTVISEIFKVQSWAGNNIPNYQSNYPYQYGGNAKILGTWNVKKDKTSELVIVCQNGTGLTGSALIFNEEKNQFTSFRDWSNIDAIDCVNNQLIAFQNGELYIFDNINNYNNFFGTNYPSEITIVVNDGQNVKKEPLAVAYHGSNVWSCPNIGDVKTSFNQNSMIPSATFITRESMFYAAIQRADDGTGNTYDSLIYLKGVWISVKFSINSNNFEYINGIQVLIKNSPKN